MWNEIERGVLHVHSQRAVAVNAIENLKKKNDD